MSKLKTPPPDWFRDQVNADHWLYLEGTPPPETPPDVDDLAIYRLGLYLVNLRILDADAMARYCHAVRWVEGDAVSHFVVLCVPRAKVSAAPWRRALSKAAGDPPPVLDVILKGDPDGEQLVGMLGFLEQAGMKLPDLGE
jgi:hypothetical protein